MICSYYWSLRSNSTPDTRDMWTDTEKESVDLHMYTDRSDSGITSPHSHHHIDDRNIVSPCDLSLLDQVSNDEVKRRITALTKKPNIDEEDKICLLQVLTLLNNLETLSQDSLLVNDEMISLEMVKSKGSDYDGSVSSSPSTLPSDIHSLQKGKRIVATVLPYSSSLSTPTDSPRRFKSWNSSSLQESGVFEGDSNDCFYSQGTQTEPEDFPCIEVPTTGDLCAEIQKLNKFREKIEEVVTKQATKAAPVPVPTLLSPNLSDQRRLQYYKDRLEQLENKILIYESSGDLQTKRLAERLQREIQLEALAKDLRQRVESLESENLKLEEERCEFEEAENDTRLHLQRLEIDLEILNQRNIELDMSREAVQNKLQEAKNQCANLQESILKSQGKIDEIEGEKQGLKTTLGLIKTSMPALVLFGALMVHGGSDTSSPRSEKISTRCPCHILERREPYNTCSCHHGQNDYVESRSPAPIRQFAGSDQTRSTSPCHESEGYESIRNSSPVRQGSIEYRNNSSPAFRNAHSPTPGSELNCEEILQNRTGGYQRQDENQALQTQLHQLMDREKELTQNISELNRAYQETMENADILWAQIERDYKDKLAQAKEIEQCLKMKITQLEQRLNNDASCAQERITQLEENETALKHKVCFLNKQNKDLLAEQETFMAEYQCVKQEMCKLKTFIEGPGQENLEREKKKVRELEEDICLMNKMVCGMEADHKKELHEVRCHLCKANKDLENIEVTNAELKEEVCTLENQICELQKQRQCDEERIQCLMDEIRAKEDNNLGRTCTCTGNRSSLAQEMFGGRGQAMENNMGGDGPGSGQIDFEGVNDLQTASQKLAEALANITNCSNCQAQTEDLQIMAKDVKEFSTNIRKALGEQVSEGGEEEDSKIGGDEEMDEEEDEEGREGNDNGGEEEGIEGDATEEATDENAADDERSDKDAAEDVTEDAAENAAEDTAEDAAEVEENIEEEVTVGMVLTSNPIPQFEYISIKEIERQAGKKTYSNVKGSIKTVPLIVTEQDLEIPLKKKKVTDSKKLLSRKVTKKPLPTKEIGLQADTGKKAEASSNSICSSTDSISSIIRKLKDVFITSSSSPRHITNTSQQTDINEEDIGNDDKVKKSARRSSPTKVHFKDVIEDDHLQMSKSEKLSTHPVEFFEIQEEEEKAEELVGIDKLGSEPSGIESPKKSKKSLRIKVKKESRLETLFELVRASVSHSEKLEDAECSLKKLYKTNKVFKENLKVIIRLKKGKEFKSYDEIVRAMACLKAIEDMYKPIIIPAIKSLEDEVNVKLLEYHGKTSEPKLYCAVYYPENRTASNPVN